MLAFAVALWVITRSAEAGYTQSLVKPIKYFGSKFFAEICENGGWHRCADYYVLVQCVGNCLRRFVAQRNKPKISSRRIDDRQDGKTKTGDSRPQSPATGNLGRSTTEVNGPRYRVLPHCPALLSPFMLLCYFLIWANK